MSRRNDYDYFDLDNFDDSIDIVADSNSAVLQAMPQDRHHSVPAEDL